MPRPIDHLVLAVPDLAAAVDLYGALGFTVGARNRHPWGTENAIVQLDGAFLELIALGADVTPLAREDPATPFVSRVAAACSRGGGLALVAMGTTDADADAAAFAAAGLGPGSRLDFGRSAEAADGTRRAVRFSLAFAEDPDLAEAGVFTCRHHHPENFWSAAAQRHVNGASRLDAVVLASGEPRRHASMLETLCGVAPSGPPGRLSIDTPTGRLAVMAPPDVAARYGGGAVAGRFAAFAVTVASLDAARACLDGAGVPFETIGGAIVVPPASTFGVALAFAATPCHSVA